MNTFTKSFFTLTLASIALVGCMAANGPATAEQGMSKGSMAKATMMKDELPEPKLNDLEIAHIAYTAGAIDIRYANLALALSEDSEIRSFAQLMIRDHTAVNNKALALVKKLQITPQDNVMSQQLSEQARQIREELSQLRGKELAKRYAANELGYHQTVNNVVENTFIPTQKIPNLKHSLPLRYKPSKSTKDMRRK